MDLKWLNETFQSGFSVGKASVNRHMSASFVGQCYSKLCQWLRGNVWRAVDQDE